MVIVVMAVLLLIVFWISKKLSSMPTRYPKMEIIPDDMKDKEKILPKKEEPENWDNPLTP